MAAITSLTDGVNAAGTRVLQPTLTTQHSPGELVNLTYSVNKDMGIRFDAQVFAHGFSFEDDFSRMVGKVRLDIVRQAFAHEYKLRGTLGFSSVEVLLHAHWSPGAERELPVVVRP